MGENRFQKAKWIGVPREEFVKKKIYQGDLNNRFAYFILDVELEEKCNLTLLISAAARYRLWINGESVISGPCKGDRYRQYYDEIEVSAYLRLGKNRFAVQVLSLDSYIINNLMSGKDIHQPLIAYAGLPLSNRLAVEGMVMNHAGKKIYDITTGSAPWKVYLEGAYTLICQQPWQIWLGAISEIIPENAVSLNWKRPETSSEGFTDALILEEANHDDATGTVGNTGALIMRKRKIPQMYEKRSAFLYEIIDGKISDCTARTMNFSAHCQKEIIFDAGVIKNGFMKFGFAGGKGTRIIITYAERFISKYGEIRRDDFEHGVIEGANDELTLNGSSVVYEPFWYRTFRYVKIKIETQNEPLQMQTPYFMETGYPIHVSAHISSSQKWVEDVWNICVRTVKRCMNETYMDCPYYEQMQFPMDTRLQALYTYLLSGDTRLAKKALEDFHYSMTPEGLIQGKYPGSHTQIISTFSLYYIFMLKEYYIWTEDIQTVHRYRPDIDLIMDYYERKQNDRGLVENLGYWEFVDWRKQWEVSFAAPEATRKGASTIINLMYAYALGCGAYLYEETGRPGIGEEYKWRQREICAEIEELCWSEERQMYREGPEFEQYSVHAQAWAVLNGMITGKDAGNLMERALKETDVIQNSFSTSFEIFEALKISERYDLAAQIFMLWKSLPEKGCTTCPEVPVNSRSECHAWSAQPIYEYIHHILGVQVLEKGWKRIKLHPDLTIVKNLRGVFVTPKGLLKFDLKSEGKKYMGIIVIPSDMKAEIVLEEKELQLHTGENKIG